jgi:hypothetical protein
MPTSSPSAPGLDRRVALWLFVAALGFFALTTGAERPWGDGDTQFRLAERLYTQARVDLPGATGRYLFRGPDGWHYSTFDLGIALSLGPSVAAVTLLAPDRRDELTWAFAHRASNTLWAAVAVVLVFLVARALSFERRPAVVAAAVAAVATQLWPYAHSDFSEVYQTCAVLAVVLGTLRFAEAPTRARAVVLGCVCGHAVLAKVTHWALAPVVLGFLWSQVHLRAPAVRGRYLEAALAFLPFAAVTLGYNVLRTGTLLGTGRQMDHFETPMNGSLLVGLYGLLFSAGKGVFLFNPILIGSALSLPAFLRARGARGVFVLACGAVLTLVYARYVFWHGAWSWGPRFLTAVVPLFVLPLLDWPRPLSRWSRGLGAAVLALSISVQVLGGAFYEGHHIHVNNAVRRVVLGKSAREGCGHCHENHWPTHFVPELSAIPVHLWLLRGALESPDDATYRAMAPWAYSVPDEVNAKIELKRPELDYLAFRPRAWAHPTLAALLVLAAAAVALGAVRLRRLLR